MQDNDLRSQIQKAKELADRLKPRVAGNTENCQFITFDEVPQPKSQEVKENVRLDVTQYAKKVEIEGDKVKITVEIPMGEYNKNFRKYLNTGMDLSVSVRSHLDKGE